MTLAYYLRKPKQSTSLERFGSGEVLLLGALLIRQKGLCKA